MSYNPIETGKRIRMIREERGISRNEFAEKLGISVSHLQKLEIGMKGHSPSMDLIVEISEIYGISTDYLLKGQSGYSDNQVKTKTELLRIISQLNETIQAM